MTSPLPVKSFAHGIHPPDFKAETNGLAVRQFPFAPVMIISLSQHAGAPARPIVSEGQEVARGQKIAEPDGFMSVAMHAPASGIVERIGLAPNAAGRMVDAVYIKPYPASTQEIADGRPCDLQTASQAEIVAAIQEAGIVGLGGAAFPTHVKLQIEKPRFVDTLLINGVECEPYLTTDHRVMLEQIEDILLGTHYTAKAAGADRAIIAIEANKPDAVEALRSATADEPSVSVQVVAVKYPQGAEKVLIKALLGREVPSGGLPADVHVVSQNVATTAEIGRLLPHGRGIMERVITIAGPGIRDKGNYLIPIGTPLRFALDQAGMTDDASRVCLGGPMMGPAASSLDIPITKGVSGIVVFTEKEVAAVPDVEYPCIRCSRCLEACPMFLNPSRLGALARNRQYEAMAEDHNLFDCFECGCCSYVCPSHIPLVQYFRLSKSLLRERKVA